MRDFDGRHQQERSDVMSRKNLSRWLILWMAVIPALAMAAQAGVQRLDGRKIMEKVLQGSTWNDMQADVTLVVTNARGARRVRKIKLHSRKRTENESDLLMRFVAPADVAGTGFLVIEHSRRDDDRYVFLPALRRTKRISSSGKGGNFMGSDFSYYDIGKPKLDDWLYLNATEDTLDGVPCYRIVAKPATPQLQRDIGYSQLIHWVRKDNLTVIKTEYYDRRGKLWKVLTVPRLEKIAGVWFQTDLVMRNVQDHRTSEMIFENIEVNQHLPKRLFTQRYLERWHSGG